MLYYDILHFYCYNRCASPRLINYFNVLNRRLQKNLCTTLTLFKQKAFPIFWVELFLFLGLRGVVSLRASSEVVGGHIVFGMDPVGASVSVGVW